MIKVIFLLAILLVAFYFYIFRKIKKNRQKLNDMNTIQDIHDSYQHLSGRRIQQKQSENYNNYVTKYNSSEDYREK